MFRKSQMQGWCCLAFGTGLLVGHSLESWLLCVCCGVGLCVFGFCALRRKY